MDGLLEQSHRRGQGTEFADADGIVRLKLVGVGPGIERGSDQGFDHPDDKLVS
jgi:hypothetical protein